MQIDILSDPIEDTFMDKNFLILLESHLTYLRNTTAVKALIISNQQLVKYIGDFYGLLDDLRINKKYHYITMRLNNLTNRGDFNSDKTFILIPDFEEINLLKNIYLTKS